VAAAVWAPTADSAGHCGLHPQVGCAKVVRGGSAPDVGTQPLYKHHNDPCVCWGGGEVTSRTVRRDHSGIAQ
jgi:hypothetical protein